MKTTLLRLLLLVLLCAFAAEAQTTSISGTITAADSQTYNNGTYTFQLVGGNGPFYLGGVLMTTGQVTITGALDGTGSFTSVAVGKTASISPAGTSWLFTACPLASAPCWSQNIGIVSGTTLNISSTITPPAIKVTPTPNVLPLAYNDSEIQGPQVGTNYYNLTSAVARICVSISGGVCTWSSEGAQAVSSVFGRTGAVAAQSGDYTCAQVTNCTTTPNVSTLIAGTNSNVGNFNWSQAGVFTSTQQNNNYSFIVTGGNTCVPGFASEKTTGALQGVICSPVAGVGSPLLYNAVEGWATNNFVGEGGSATNAFFGNSTCTVGGSECELMSGGVNDASSQSNTILVGYEGDIGVRNASTTGYAFLAIYQSNTQATVFNAFDIKNNGTTGQFTHGFRCEAGTISNATNLDPCLFMDGQATSGNYNSNSIWAASHSTTNGNVTGSFSLAYPGFWEVRQPIIFQPVSGGIEGAGIFLTSTAGLSKNQLVKIDTANADSVVVCTTADTSCDGFVADQLGSANGGFCTAASAFCGIITMPGSLVKGIIGTSTCAIGNFVIVDTTTNGDIQCTGTPPTIGKVIGKALSACAAACAGTTIDVLTKFE